MRDIARALETALYKIPESSLHWINVIGEDSLQPVPTRDWLFNESLLQVSIADGFSEGSLVYVHEQKDRYKPDGVTALFRIKFLCSTKNAFAEAKSVYEFFHSKDYLELTGQV